MAGIDKLTAFSDLGLVDQYARAYSILPRLVLKEKTDDVMPFLVLWQKQSEYRDRYDEIKKDDSKTT